MPANEHPTVAKNRAHREDLTWVKVGPSEYLRSDGVSVRKQSGASRPSWSVYLPSGARSQMPLHRGQRFVDMPAAIGSLTLVKAIAEEITPDSPRFVEYADRAPRKGASA